MMIRYGTALRPTAVAAALVALAAGEARAQGGATAAVVLELPASARAMALGGAYAALGGDEAVLFYNPAGLATVERPSFGLSVQRHIAASTLAALSAGMRLGPGTFAAGVQALDYGSEPEIVPDPDFGGERGMTTGADVSAQDLVLSAGYAVGVRQLRAGATAKLVRQRIANESGSAGAVDLGVAADLPYGATIGVAMQNLGGDLTLAGSSAPLPRVLRIGAALPAREVGPLRVTATAELSQAREGRALPAGGVEATWRSTNGVEFAGRVGGAAHVDEAAASAVAFGAGVTARHLVLDYAYQGYDVVGGGVHRVGVRWRR